VKKDDGAHFLSVKALYDENNAGASDILQLCGKRKIVRSQQHGLSQCDSAVSQLKVISSIGQFSWAFFRFELSVFGRSSAAATSGGKVNLGYSGEGPAGKRITTGIISCKLHYSCTTWQQLDCFIWVFRWWLYWLSFFFLLFFIPSKAFEPNREVARCNLCTVCTVISGTSLLYCHITHRCARLPIKAWLTVQDLSSSNHLSAGHEL